MKEREGFTPRRQPCLCTRGAQLITSAITNTRGTAPWANKINKWDKALRIQSEKQHGMSSPQDSWCNWCLQWLIPLVWSAASGSADTLCPCFLQAASQPEWAGSWGPTWTLLARGVGATGAQWSAEGVEVCAESCPVPSPSPAFPAGLNKCLELTPFALPGRHWSLLK